jgi:hypothetical protein
MTKMHQTTQTGNAEVAGSKRTPLLDDLRCSMLAYFDKMEAARGGPVHGRKQPTDARKEF